MTFVYNFILKTKIKINNKKQWIKTHKLLRKSSKRLLNKKCMQKVKGLKIEKQG